MCLIKSIIIAFFIILTITNSIGAESKNNLPNYNKVIPIYFQSDVGRIERFINKKIEKIVTDEMIRSYLSFSTQQLKLILESEESHLKESMKIEYNYEVLADKLIELIHVDQERFAQNFMRIMEKDKEELATAWVKQMQPASQEKIVEFFTGKKENQVERLAMVLIPVLVGGFLGFLGGLYTQKKAAEEERRKIEYEKGLEKLDSIYPIVLDAELQYFPSGILPSSSERVNDRPSNQKAAYQSLRQIGSTLILSSDLRKILKKLMDELNPFNNGKIVDENGNWREVNSQEVFNDLKKVKELIIQEKEKKI